MQYVKRPGTGNGRTVHVQTNTGYTLCGLDGDVEEFIAAPLAWITCSPCALALDDLLTTLADEAESAGVEAEPEAEVSQT